VFQANQLSVYFLGTMAELFGGTKAEQDRIRQGEENMQRYNEKVSARGPGNLPDMTSGLTGPKYSFADEMKTPSEIGVRSGGDVGAISDAVAGINYYTDVIGFGQRTGINKHDMKPMGLRYFMSTGSVCSNGALMFEYIDTTPQGDLLGKRIGKAITDMGLPGMKGLAPGMLEDARDALNPLPIFSAAMGSGYPKCKQVTLPVGDLNGHTRSPYDAENVWIKGTIGPNNMQTRWVQDKDAGGNLMYMSAVDYQNEPKTYYPDGTPIEGFANPQSFLQDKKIATLLFVGLIVSMGVFVVFKKH
jgi:hypothetical protein